MEENELDKSEVASPFKLKRAREKGTVARGVDIGFFAALAGFIAYAWLAGQAAVSKIAHASGVTFRNAAFAHDSNQALLQQAAFLFGVSLKPLLFLGGTVFAIILLVEFLQVGPVFSAHPLKPDFKRINPAQGLKRIFSWRMLIEAFKSLIKLGIYGTIAWLVIMAALNESSFAISDGGRLVAAMGTIGFRLLLFFALAAMFMAAIDQILSRREFAKKMRMSRRELKREHRDREGDPRLKQKRREFHGEFLKMAKSLRGARDADIILTNPTHYAVALRYAPHSMEAPHIVSRGAGNLAERIRRIGFVYGVTVVQDAALARGLFRTGILDAEVPDSFYSKIAELYRSHDLVNRHGRRMDRA